MLTDLLFFLFTGATLTLLIWTGMELFRNQEDPLGDRLEGLQSQAMVVAARAARRRQALAVYTILVILFVLSLAAGLIYLQRNSPPTSLIGGLAAVLILGFILPKQVLYRMVRRYRRKLQEALPDTVDLLGIVLGTGLSVGCQSS
ncbi:MAG: hypothetical protein ABSG79_25845 [Bryobacteraceae bacterium]|jgi:Flp pilus assembly protein TadB